MGLLAAAAVTASPAASAATSIASEMEAGKSCAVELSKVKPGSPDAKIQRYACADTQEKAAAMLPADIRRVGLAVFYEHSYQSGRSYGVYGDSPCDSAGWGFSDLNDINNQIGISSYETFNACNAQIVYKQVRYGGLCGFYNGFKQNISVACNDQVRSMKVYAAST
ncbi:hypothetical protein DMH01_15460 [Amycolatopsis sp. WAC 04182]|nr:hypothetical protein DMH01_15460 [Amycolatopsis sp. WAC 04182]